MNENLNKMYTLFNRSVLLLFSITMLFQQRKLITILSLLKNRIKIYIILISLKIVKIAFIHFPTNIICHPLLHLKSSATRVRSAKKETKQIVYSL